MRELILCVIYDAAAKVAEVVDRVSMGPSGKTFTAENAMQIYFDNMFSGSRHSKVAKDIIDDDNLRDSSRKTFKRNCDAIDLAKRQPCELVPSRDGILRPMRLPRYQQNLEVVRPRHQQDRQHGQQHGRRHIHYPGHRYDYWQDDWQDDWPDYWHADARRRPTDVRWQQGPWY